MTGTPGIGRARIEPAGRGADQGLSRLVTYRIGRLHAKLNVQATRLLAAHDGPTLGQWRVLTQVALAEPTTLGDIARDSDTDKGLLSRNLSGLVASGLVSQIEDDHDHRRLLLRLTARGRSLHGRLVPIMRARQERLTGGLTPEERHALERAIDKIDAAIAADLGE